MENPAEQIPPLLNPPRTKAPLQLFGLLVAGLVIAKLTSFLSFGLPICTFKAFTGIPCAFCGGTRAFRALASLHFHDALMFNPLATLGAIGIVLWFVAWLIAPQRVAQIGERASRLRLWPYVLAVVALNWIFVINFLPR